VEPAQESARADASAGAAEASYSSVPPCTAIIDDLMPSIASTPTDARQV